MIGIQLNFNKNRLTRVAGYGLRVLKQYKKMIHRGI